MFIRVPTMIARKSLILLFRHYSEINDSVFSVSITDNIATKNYTEINCENSQLLYCRLNMHIVFKWHWYSVISIQILWAEQVVATVLMRFTCHICSFFSNRIPFNIFNIITCLIKTQCIDIDGSWKYKILFFMTLFSLHYMLIY